MRTKLINKTMALKNENCIGGKLSKERDTKQHLVNMNDQKEKLLKIGETRLQRAFKKH